MVLGGADHAFERPRELRGGHSGDDDTAVLVGAGDIADCRDLSGAEATAKLLDKVPGTVMADGDLAYPDGTKENFACYDKTWGPRQITHQNLLRAITIFILPERRPYFDLFRRGAGDPNTGYYSYELGKWHIIALNSECQAVGGCEAGSPQNKWLRADLAKHPAVCTLAYWHKPLFSSGGVHGNDLTVKPLFQALYEAGADVVVGGHDHDYERFAPQDPEAHRIPSAAFANSSPAPVARASGPSGRRSPTAKCVMRRLLGVSETYAQAEKL